MREVGLSGPAALPELFCNCIYCYEDIWHYWKIEFSWEKEVRKMAQLKWYKFGKHRLELVIEDISFFDRVSVVYTIRF